MSKLREILPNIYGVKVPSDAVDFKKYYDRKNKWYVEYSKIYILNEIPIEFDFKILGTITKDEISFDASDVVDSEFFDDMDYDGRFIQRCYYWDYETKRFELIDSDESFRSALPKEIYFEHPEGDLKYCCNSSDCGCLGYPINIVSKEHWEDYQTAQENITEKLLILQKL